MRRLALAVTALAVGSCNCGNPAAQNGTALFVIVELGGLTVDQLAFSISTDPTVLRRPEPPGADLTDPQTLRLLLPRSLAGQTIGVRVDGSHRKTERGSGEASVLVVSGLETEVRVRLTGLPVGDGGTGGGSDAGRCGADNCAGCCEGQECRGGNDPGACGTSGNTCEACASNDTCAAGACQACSLANCGGCCRGSLCVESPSVVFCGANGSACRSCPPLRSECQADGTCGCGNGPVCATGQRCKTGSCVCDALSCPDGCCDGIVCRKGDPARCGFAGAQCTTCPSGRTDRCSLAGACACGAGPACGVDQLCVGGVCVCNAASCPTGCCDGNICRTQRSTTYCGPPGGSCTPCDTVRANVCNIPGGCLCTGSGRMCGPDEHCTTMGCVCDALTCPTGCCNGGLCERNPTSARCGANGGECSTCSGAPCDGGICAGGGCLNCMGCCSAGISCTQSPTFPVCANGTGTACLTCDQRSNGCGPMGCSCDGGDACQVGQFCNAVGACECGPASCNGCCTALGECVTGDALGSCGTGGAACASCSPAKADDCDLGQCRCGGSSACGPGHHCVAGKCTCDPATCPGCCSGDTCVKLDAGSLMACGGGGSTCLTCDSSRADQCVGGACRCGTRPQCGVGEQCQNGNCVCSPGTGCTGCCVSGSQCVPLSLTADSTCGSGGAACGACSGAHRCRNGACCLLDVFGRCLGSG